MTINEIKQNELGDIDKLIAEGNKCIYCGKKLDGIEKENINYAKAIKRYFPICSSECEASVTKYVENDRTHKMNFYRGLTLCAITTLIGALFNKPVIAFIGVVVCGLSMFIFPYPITSFETFVNNPIKTTTRLVRIIGIIIAIVGAFFLFMTATGRTTVSFA